MPSTKAENSKQTLGPENLSQYLIVLVFDLGSVTPCYGAVPSYKGPFVLLSKPQAGVELKSSQVSHLGPHSSCVL